MRFKHYEDYQDDGQCICWGIDDTKRNYVYNMNDCTVLEVSEKQLIDLLNRQEDYIQELIDENFDLKREVKSKNLQCSKLIEDNVYLRKLNNI